MSHACQRHLYLIVLVDISELASCIPVHLDSWASTYIGHIEVALSHVVGPWRRQRPRQPRSVAFACAVPSPTDMRPSLVPMTTSISSCADIHHWP
ncbi:hypothetical protein EV363DRAFT_1366970 [Boletus edulis]|uniref:Secreted protein n=1 Tax=Boletus edulis BED1 TaxID=1328754 RepID=A0AAD4G6A5_BOLED|nr:hypothetical protein EV363DRAFT_1366970 [Boletus edulis]KAF8417375.1 hypothetical protein L210DRAFT_3580977 [Boletus edulis BED1]